MENNILSAQLSLFGGIHIPVNFNTDTKPSTPATPAPPPARIHYKIVEPINSFTGSEQILKELHKGVERNKSNGNNTVPSQTTVITGIGGLGKTQTVRKYVLEYKGEYAHMLWINAENYSLANDCFIAIASLCNISSENFGSRRAVILDKIYDYVCAGEKPCLIVFDNADSMGTAESKDGIQPFLPAEIKPGWQKPAILVTSRKPHWKHTGVGHVIQLPGLNEEECFELLSKELTFPQTNENQESAMKIREMCEGLPLVAQQVIAYIRATDNPLEVFGDSAFTLKDFMIEVEGGGLDITTLPADCPVGYTAFQIFKMAFKRMLAQENGGIAFRCLCVMSFLNPDNIPAKLLAALIDVVTKNRTALSGALNVLRNQNLVTLHGRSFYTIHRVVQGVAISYMKTKCGTGRTARIKTVLMKRWKEIRGKPGLWFTSADILTSIIPPFLKYLENIPLEDDSLNAVIQNGLQITSHLKNHSEVKLTTSVQTALAEKLKAAEKFSEAENLWKDVLGTFVGRKGTSAEELYAKSQLAWAYLKQGKYDAAMKIYKEVLEVEESELGTDHKDTLVTKDMIAAVYRNQGKYDDAIELHEYVLKNMKIQFGRNDSRTTATKTNLANALQRVGKYERAIELYDDVIKYEELQLGLNNRETLLTRYNLAELLREMGKYDEALEMFEDTLKVRESKLGRNHIDTLKTKSSLALALMNKGEYGRALQLYEETLKAQISQLGHDHTHTLITENNFALLHKKLGNYDTAVEMLEDVLKTREKALGPNHPLTINTKNDLAVTLHAKCEYGRASEL